MISVSPNGSNGVHAAKLTQPCPSDYEPIDITPFVPKTPKPGWRDAHAAFTHHLQWTDSDGHSHGLTLRSDSLQDLLADLRMVKQMIKAAKEKHAAAPPNTAAPEPDSDVPPCKIHGAPMERKQSKRTGGIYFSHRLPSGELCFGHKPTA